MKLGPSDEVTASGVPASPALTLGFASDSLVSILDSPLSPTIATPIRNDAGHGGLPMDRDPFGESGGWGWIVEVSIWTGWMVAIALHPVHETFAEIEWNRDTRRLEVALRLDVLDEQWLARRAGDPPRSVPEWAIDYLRQRFRVAERPEKDRSDPTTYRWIGRDEQGAHVWWYFEIEPADGKRPSWIDHRVLLERADTHTNRILILDHQPARSQILTIERPRANLNQATNEPDDVLSESTAPLDR